MAYIIDIATAVPQYAISNTEVIDFYSNALKVEDSDLVSRKMNFLLNKTKIQKRYSCIADFKGENPALYLTPNYNPSVEKRTEIYKQNSLPLAVDAIDKLFEQTKVNSKEITHLITVSCTGIFAPGLEFLVAKHYGLEQSEKLGLNFLGCYAAIKALKHANYIAEAVPSACILIICVELCSLHFTPSALDEEMLANLLFADGAAAVLVTGKDNINSKNKTLLQIGAASSAIFPNTFDLMTWNISSFAFQMFLSREIAEEIAKNIFEVVNNFFSQNSCMPDYWAIHPGGVKIIEAVQQSLNLSDTDMADSLHVLKNYGNMSSPTILFVLKRIFDKLKANENEFNKNIFACAFGPGLSIEMLQLSLINTTPQKEFHKNLPNYEFQI
jgi:alpha-pyrone synthase